MKEFYDYKINDDGYAEIVIDSNIFEKDIIITSAYVLLEKAYFTISCLKDNNISVKLKLKDDLQDKLNTILDEFYKNLIIYKEYKNNYENNKDIRLMLMQRAIVTNEQEQNDLNTIEDELDFENMFSEEDLKEIEEIAKPWEEKFSK